MNLLKKLILITCVGLFSGEFAFADTYFIDRNRATIFNHGDATKEYTIAWYFKKYGEDNTFILNTPASEGSYAIYEPLVLPRGSTLESSSSGKSWIRSYNNIDWILQVFDSSKISNVVLDGNYLATQVIHGNKVNGFILEESVLRRTINVNDPLIVDIDKRVRAHIVTLVNSTNLIISNNDIQNAGDNGANVANNGLIEASGLFLTGGDQITVTGNNIRHVLSAGINTTNSRHVEITNNIIDNTGRANLYRNPFPADAITGYHNTRFLPSENLYYSVTNNVITNWHNHGIHLSGRWINISNNSVTSPGVIPLGLLDSSGDPITTGHGIFVGDFRDRVRCSSIIWIQNNHIQRSTAHPTDQADGIRVAHYKHGAYWPYGNTGDVGNGVNVTDHRYNNLRPIGQLSCPIGFADEYY